MFRPLVAAFPCLVVIPLMVWRLSAPLAALSGHAAGSETASDRVDIADLWYIAVAGEYDVVRVLLLVILACLLIFMWRIPVIDEKQQKR